MVRTRRLTLRPQTLLLALLSLVQLIPTVIGLHLRMIGRTATGEESEDETADDPREDREDSGQEIQDCQSFFQE